MCRDEVLRQITAKNFYNPYQTVGMCAVCCNVSVVCIRFEVSGKGVTKICSPIEILSEMTIHHNEVSSYI